MAHVIYCPKCSQYHVDGAKCIRAMTPEQEQKWFRKQMAALDKFDKLSRRAKPVLVK